MDQQFLLMYHGNQDLINRLEHYQEIDTSLLQQAIRFIDDTIIPQVARHAISGHVMIRT